MDWLAVWPHQREAVVRDIERLQGWVQREGLGDGACTPRQHKPSMGLIGLHSALVATTLQLSTTRFQTYVYLCTHGHARLLSLESGR